MEKQFVRLWVLVLFMLTDVVVSAAEIAVFDMNHYIDWTYSRDVNDVELNSVNIGNNRIRLFRSRKGQDYTLTSPELNLSSVDSIAVVVDYVVGEPTYVADKLALTMEFVGSDGEVCGSVVVAALPSLVKQTMEGHLAIPSGKSRLQLRLASYRADVDNNAAVRSVQITGLYDVRMGDVNNDGVWDVMDLNLLINLMLTDGGTPFMRMRGDINRDTIIDVVDLNLLINRVLM